MQKKKSVRRKYYFLRRNKYYEIKKDYFSPLVSLIRSKLKKNFFKLALYYPSAFEVNVLRLLELDYISNQKLSLPLIGDNNVMNFFSWKKNEALKVNKFGMLEPIKSNLNIPEVMLVPLLAFDSDRYRLGYGKGFYDRYLNKYKNILTVGVAFSFQKHHKLPIDNKDVKLNYILTEKGIY
ncbi:5-formyltetrahydrofolate cyclo-ligase [Pelagibacteraceae bacterium]|jgi:5-formyltetrahydrofolate cyclo-ligase|nr:5-formyltetrahydrofolate cyclo-ligase [Pelagibacteraceae bacterium]MDC0952963.1 5-formyltetrahydrofolate cyclo-ligase [Pelagibacteraceae bacterium]